MTGGEDLYFLCLRFFWKKALPNNILSNVAERASEYKNDIVDYDPNVPDFIIHFIFIFFFLSLSLSFIRGVKGDAFCVTLARMTSDPSYLEQSIE